MQLVAPVSDYIPGSVLTTVGDYVVRGAVIPERRAERAFCHVARQFAQVIANNSWVTIDFDFVVVDRGADFDDVNHRFVCPREGTYLVSVCASWENFNDGVEMRLQIMCDGTSYFSGFTHPGGAGENGHSGFCIVPADAGDFITARVHQLSGGNESLDGSYNTIDIFELP